MPRPFPSHTVETTLLSRWQDPLAMAAPTPSPGWMLGPDGGELQRRATACYAQLQALPRRVRRALQRKLALPLMGVALLLALGQEPSQAATTWTVCASGCAYTTIQAAINAATTVAGDLIMVRDAVHTEAGITVTKDLSIAGHGVNSTVVQAAATPNTARARVFTIASGITATIQGLTIRHGSSHDGGGLLNEGTLTLTNSTVSGNTATRVVHYDYYGSYSYGGYGGGLCNSRTLTLTNSTVSGNFADFGGGGLSNTGTLTLTNSTVSGNAAVHGGGLWNNGTLTLTNSTISDNFASAGGGLSNAAAWGNYTYYGTATLTNSTVSGNSATSGGGLLNEGLSSTLRLINSTVSGNAAVHGGGLWNYGNLTLTNSTVTGNAAGHGGGLYTYVYTRHGAFQTGDVWLINSIVANNPVGGDCRASLTFHTYSLDSDGSCHLTAPTDLPGVDPLLGPLQDNGGPTFTHALLPGSPAIDAIPWGTNGCGTTLVSDQRWQARPQPAGGLGDIGAYEVGVAGQPIEAWVTGVTSHTAVCQNVTTGQAVTINDPAPVWDCEAAGLGVTAGDEVALHLRGPVVKGTTDVGGAVVGMVPTSGGCTNLTTGQQVTFQHMKGATAGSCVAAGLVIHPKDSMQIRVQGVAE